MHLLWPVLCSCLLSVAVNGQKLEETECPHQKPHKCPYGGMCYGSFEYCGPEGPETCVQSQDTHKLCLEVARGKNVSDQIRHESCNLLADCVDKYGPDLFNGQKQDESIWKIFGIVSPIISLIAIGLTALICFCTRQKRLKKSLTVYPGENGSQDCEAPSPPFPMENISRVRGERDQPQGLSSEASANYNEQQHLLGEEQDNGSRDPTTSPDYEPPLCTTLRNNATDRQSARPVQNGSGFIFSGSTSSSSSSDTQIHPAEEESNRQRAVHIAETLPAANAERCDMLVTSITPHVTNGGNVI